MFKNKLILGSILCLIASMSWGAMFPVAHVALQHINPFYFSLIRYSIVSLILVVILWAKEGKSAFRLERRGKALLFYGTMAFTVYNLLVFIGQHLMGEAGTVAASIMEVLMPIISILVLWITTRNKPKKYMLTSIVIALIGALLVITNGKLSFFTMAGQNLFPLLLIFIGVVGWVLYSMGGETFKDWSPLRYSTLTCLLGTAVSLIVVGSGTAFQLISVPTWHDVLTVKYELSFMILLPGLVALLSWNAGIKMISPLNGILFINFVPITTFIVMAFQGYQISMYELCGTLLVIFALLRSNAYERKAATIDNTITKKRMSLQPKIDTLKEEGAH
ncbi:DMT family transporter [Paenibacillus sp. FA6]|uniref:DMT family transporter n=1 Tax=Paenibacillus sp. FA6 TaxID=3413029 RepID=UPI003F654D85